MVKVPQGPGSPSRVGPACVPKRSLGTRVRSFSSSERSHALPVRISARIISSTEETTFRAPRLDHLIILFGSGCLVCLTPLAIYLLYLAHLNGRTTPTLVPGPWDFGAVLLGLSGFLILAGPLLLTVANSVWRGYAVSGWAELRVMVQREAMAGSLMAVGYLLVVGAGIAWLLRGRRPVTAVYNVAATTTETTLVEVLEQLGYPSRRADGRIEIDTRKTIDPATPPRFFPHEMAAVKVTAFPATGHATLRWAGEYDGVRSEVEAVLPAALVAHAGHKNPVAGWLTLTAVSILGVMLLWLAVLIYIVMTPMHS
jgi:hypothetical protein